MILKGKRLRLLQNVLDELSSFAGSGAGLEDHDLRFVHSIDDPLTIAVDGQRFSSLLHDG